MNNKTECSFFQIYELIPSEFHSYKIKDIDFSVRTEKRLLSAKIENVEDLLNSTPNQLMSIKGFGNGCLKEIEAFCMELDEAKVYTPDESRNSIIPKIIKENKDLIFSGLFPCVENLIETPTEIKAFTDFEEAYSIIGRDMVEEIRKGSDIAQKFRFYVVSLRKSADIISKLSNIIHSGNANEKKSLKAYPLINAYTLDEIKREKLRALFKFKNARLSDFKLPATKEDEITLMKFLRWCDFDISEEIRECIKMFESKDGRTLKVLQMRGKGASLRVIGEEIGVTRERVRQIENKSIKKFLKWNSKYRILSKICALRDNDMVLTPSELDEYFHPYTDVFVLMLKAFEGGNYYYDKDLDVFIVGDMNMDEQCSEYLEGLPNTFKVNKLDDYVRDGVMLGINEEYLRKMIDSEYTHSFDVYHRTRLSLTSIYEEILNKYYTNGIHIYDPEEIKKFRSVVISEYGNVSLPKNDRAISARLADIGILCDRGKYKPKQKKYISIELEKEIKASILNSSERIFPISSIFDIFQEQLIDFGIDNKYYMQGVLRELMEDEFTFKRDYILKGNSDANFYSEIINFIKVSEYPVDKSDIQNKYPGITDVVIALATSDRNILNFFGKYIHASKLKWTIEERRYFANTIELLIRKDILNTRDLYAYIENDNPSIMMNLGIYNQFSLFSVLNFFLEDLYQFDRPYITRYGINAEYPAEYLAEKIADSDEVSINRIVEYSRRNHISLFRIIEYLNGLNDTHLLVNHKTIVKIDLIGVNEEIAKIVEDLIVEEINGTVPIRNLMCINKFPSINVEWDEWLIYSIINKWSTKLEVAMSDPQFRRAYPLVSKVGEIDITGAEKTMGNDKIAKIDDLDNIDELIADIIFEEVDGPEI